MAPRRIWSRVEPGDTHLTWLFLAVPLLVLFIALYLSVKNRNLVDISVESREVVVRPRGWNKGWTLKGSVRFSLASIEKIEVHQGLRDLPKGLQFPGTSFPGFIRAGTYRRRGENYFYAVRDGKDVVVIALRGEYFAQVIVQTKDPHGAVALIEGARGQSPSTD